MLKFKKVCRIIILSLTATFLSSCQNTMEQNPKETLGNILGAGIGGLLGAQIGGGKGQLAAVAAGALAGTYFGGGIGKSLDRADKLFMDQNAEQGLEYAKTGATTKWENPDSGNSGSFKPTKTYKASTGQNCREFESTVFIEGKTEVATGKACREADGTWKIMN